jgi:tetratricopeptide (TPR) repeat protein
MAKIYVSATFRDLKDYRDAVYRILRKMRHDVISMEDYVATDRYPLQKCLEDVAACDVYVGIIAWRYGYIPDEGNPERKSITELEYEMAGRAGRARLVFLLDRDTSWPREARDAENGEGDGGQRIDALRREMERAAIVNYFGTPDQLASQVSAAVYIQLAGQPGVRVEQDATGNAVISGNGTVVIVQTSRPVPADEPIAAVEFGPNPYKGLVAFHEEDAGRFFGREEQTARLWEAFRRLHEPSPEGPPALRLLAILGPSGSGKSSLARAGFIPELARRPLPGLDCPRVAVLTPGAHPIEALAGVLARTATGDPAPVAKSRELSDELRLQNRSGECDGLRRIADSLPGIASSPVIVLVDQFEEVYSLCEDKAERDAFIANLLHAARDRSARVSVVLTLRSDFLGQTQKHPDLNAAVATSGILIPAMDEDELRRAVAEPAVRAGHPLDDATVELLIEQTRGREGALPLLQFALARIWEGMSKGVAPFETLRRTGGLGGALAGEAQRLYDSLPTEDDKAIVRRAFLGLVRLGEGTRDTRRRIAVPDIVSFRDDRDHVERVLRVFSSPAARFITLSADARGNGFAEIAHEALFEQWTELRSWLDSSRDEIRFHRRLDEAARHWDSHGRPEGLLWRPPDLDLLRSFHARAGGELELTPVQLDFFVASKNAEEREILEREQRKAGQLENERRFAAAQLENQRRVARLLRAGIVILAAGILVSATLCAWAFWERRQVILSNKMALENKREALVNEKQAIDRLRQARQAHGAIDRMLERLGGVMVTVPGALDALETFYARSIEEFELADQGDAEGAPWRFAAAKVRCYLGEVQKGLGKIPAAEATLRRAQSQSEPLLQGAPDNADYRALLAMCRLSLGDLLASTAGTFRADDPRQIEGEQLCGKAISDYRSLADMHPEEPYYRRCLAASLGCLGEQVQLRDVTRSEQLFRDAESAYTSAIERGETTSILARARNRNALAAVLLQQGCFEDAEAKFRAIFEEIEPLLKQGSVNREGALELLAGAEAERARCLDKQGHWSEAEAAYRLAIDRFAALEPAGHETWAVLRSQAIYQLLLANVLFRTGRTAEARKDCMDSIKTFAAAISRTEQVPELADWYGFSMTYLGRILGASADHERAKEAHRAAIEYLRGRRAKAGDDTIYLEGLAICHGNLGLELRAQGLHEEALQAFNQAIELEQALAIRDPDMIKSRFWYPDGAYASLADLRFQRGLALLALKRPAETMQEAEKLLALENGGAPAAYDAASLLAQMALQASTDSERRRAADAAFGALEKAERRGLSDFSRLASDRNFEAIKSDPRYKALLARHQAGG